MFALLILLVVVLALFVVMNLSRGPGFGPRRGRTIVVERDAPRDVIVEREVPRRRVVEREVEVERPTVVEREYDV